MYHKEIQKHHYEPIH